MAQRGKREAIVREYLNNPSQSKSQIGRNVKAHPTTVSRTVDKFNSAMERAPAGSRQGGGYTEVTYHYKKAEYTSYNGNSNSNYRSIQSSYNNNPSSNYQSYNQSYGYQPSKSSGSSSSVASYRSGNSRRSRSYQKASFEEGYYRYRSYK
jgi:hypothetical protein